MGLADLFDCMCFEEEYENCVNNEFSKAVDEKDEQQINLLIKKESRLRENKVSRKIQTFLHVVAERGTIETASKLLELGADVNARNKADETPIYCAICNSPEMVEFLVENGAEVNLRNKKGESPLHRAVRLQLPKMVKRLLYDEADANFQIKSVAEYKLDAYGRIRNRLKDLGMTPLHDACKNGDVEIVRTLLQFGANVRIKDNDDRLLPIHYATMKNSFEIVDLLLQSGLDVDIRNVPEMYMPLFIRNDAYFKPKRMKVEMIEYLLYCGGYINEDKSKRGTEILSVASFLQKYDIVECLLELGVNYKKPHCLFQCRLERFFQNRVPYSAFGHDLKVFISFVALREKSVEDYMYSFIEYSDHPDRVLQRKEKVIDLFEKSKLEQEKLKSTKVLKGKKVSFYDILSRDIYSAVQIAKSKKIKNVFISKIYRKEFPLYAYLLEKRFERITYSENWVEKTEDFLLNYGDIKLPILVVRKILSYLRSVDFQIFGKVLSTRRG